MFILIPVSIPTTCAPPPSKRTGSGGVTSRARSAPSIEGIRLLDVPAGCVQYHPEAGPGPHDSVGMFDEFIEAIANA
jgi:carbamoyl-phosphate synthase small subunit